ncbi:acyl-CoA reductase [Sphingobacterium hungaricum]|uniref:Acyl-CoA reductase n=1 Tax=Sphingobacterium hungaricum TaxID=2082723 RepID=A0A928YNP1_9SPHI|nr:acyl-CoA reductase [Sphingobacterium hungaricum]MBE8712256.1 acyl-CoA reductase [Sphingobacterium hungaricum]
MTQNKRIQAFTELGTFLNSVTEHQPDLVKKATHINPWYTEEYIKQQFEALASNLAEEKLTSWLANYPDIDSSKRVGLILAGNIPLVGFNDVLAVLIAGFTASIKLSSDDAGLTSFVLNKLIEIEPEFKDKIDITEKLANFDLIIATGSDNSSRYFDYYFGKKPHIIRKNRNSVAVLSGNETAEELTGLGHDIFDYFGLGCRSVSKLFVPKNYEISQFFEGVESFSPIRNHYKYSNNYDYNKSIYLINRDEHYDNGFLILKKDERTSSPLAVVYFEEYEDINQVVDTINEQSNQLQCLVSHIPLDTSVAQFAFGESQKPSLTDYADDVDTLAFLFANQ